MLKFNWLIIIAICVGALVPLQTSINTFLGTSLKSPLMATLINFFVGLITVTLLITLFFRDGIPSFSELGKVPWYAFLAGTLGVLFVTTVVVLTPKIGVTNMLAGAIVGQLVMSILFDHFAWFNMPQHSITWQRALGVLFLILGIIFTQK